jgi:hypothetical protein
MISMRLFFAAMAAMALTAAQIAAQSSPAPTPAAGQSGLSPSTSNGSGAQIMTGTVTRYKAGESIAIKLGDGKELSFSLDKSVRADGLVAPGQLAAVMWSTDNTGKQRVTSITSAPGPGDSGMASLASGYQEMSMTPAPKGMQVTAAPTNAPTILTPGAPTPGPATTATPRHARRKPTPAPTP